MTRRRVAALAVVGVVMAALLLSAAPAPAAKLRAGAGRADITPPTGFHMMGWVRSDARVIGQHTRLFARALVLQRGKRRLVLVAADLNAIPGGLVKDATARLRGFSERNVIVSASHTHAAPTGFYNFGTYNTVFPTLSTPADFRLADTAADPKLYGFMVRQLARAIRRAARDTAPAASGWGATRLLGLTENRSLEAHLANHGIERQPGDGSVELDPLGYPHTVDPHVNVLRVDQLRRRRGRRVRVPIGIWSAFANHGTVNRASFRFYNADHHGSATRVVERRLRRAGAVPSGQEVVNVYGNTDEGDVSAGLRRNGPAAADLVGRREARAMLAAWRRAGRRLARRPRLGLRWTRICFCGQRTDGGAVDDGPVIGLPLLTGSEEGRGPLFDVTGVAFEGVRGPVDAGPQGHKVTAIPGLLGEAPTAVPLSAARIGDRAIVTVPGEMTAEMGRRVRAAVRDAVRGSGISRPVISGLANEYVQYFTTPEEFDRQHYEGGSTLFGAYSSNLIAERLADLAGRLARGRPAPEPFEFDPTNGVVADRSGYGPGAAAGEPVAQPAATPRLGRARFEWRGGPRGLDRPLERPFVRVQRRDGPPRGALRDERPRPGASGRAWRTVASDLGLQILWSVDGNGLYTARWEVPLDAQLGTYRFRVTANRYRLRSTPFRVRPSTELEPRVAALAPGRATVRLRYPAAVPERDITHRPARARGGRIALRLGGRREVVEHRRGRAFRIRGPAGASVTIPAGAARDRFGNRSSTPLTFTLPAG